MSSGGSFLSALLKVGENIGKSNDASPFKRFIYSLLIYLILGLFIGSIYWFMTLVGGNSSTSNAIAVIVGVIFAALLTITTGIEAIFSVIYQIAIFIQSIKHFKEGPFWSIMSIIVSLVYFGVAVILFKVLILK